MHRALVLAVTSIACHGSGPAPVPRPPPPPPPAADTTAFVDATVLAMDREAALPHHTVIVRGDRIVALGPVASTPVPEGAKRIDARGKWLAPGLADMHVHTFDPRQLALFVTRGVTTIRVMWGDPATLGVREAIRRGDPRLAPSIYTAGEIVDGKPPIWPGSISVTNAAEATAVVERQHREGYDFVKVYSLLPKDAYDAIVAAAGKLGVPVIGHVPYAVGLAGVLAAKQKSIEHLDGYMRFAEREDSPVKTARDFGKRMAAYKYADDGKLADAIARTTAAGTWNCPTLVVLDRISRLDHPDRARPEYKLVPPAMIASWDPAKDFRFRNSTADDFATMRGMVAWAQVLVKRLADAGAPILAGTDVGNPWLVPGDSLHDELALLVAAKLTPMQALRAATTTAAAFFGGPEHHTIAAGQRADLILLDADPLADIANTRKLAGVMLRGRWLPAAELATERERIAAIYAGTRSRFADAPAPAAARLYNVSAPFVSGEERILATGARLVGETRLDGEPDARWELAAGPRGTGDSLRVVFDGLDVTATRAAGRLQITGRVGAAQVALDEPIADDELLGGAPLAIDLLWLRTLGDVAPDAQRTIKLATVQLRPLRIEHQTLTATRQPDKANLHVFRVQVGPQSSDVTLADDGWPVETATHARR